MFLLLAGRRSDRSRKRRPVKIVSFDTDDAGTTSAPASNVVSPTAWSLPACHGAIDAKIPTSSELNDGTAHTEKALSCDTPSSPCNDTAGADLAEPHISSAMRDELPVIANTVETSLGESTLPNRNATSTYSDFSKHRTSSLPNMGQDFSLESYGDLSDLSSQDVNALMCSTASTVKPDDLEGQQDLPTDNAWFSDFRVTTADADSIGSNASTASSSSANNQLWFVIM